MTDLLTIEFGPLSGAVSQEISTADHTRLWSWLRHVLTAATLDEVFDQTVLSNSASAPARPPTPSPAGSTAHCPPKPAAELFTD